MSIVIVGGNECMERAYCDKCADYGHRAKVYTMRRKDFPRVFGNPDLCILFTSTVSHTMTQAACELARKKKVTVLRSHTSSLAALDGLLRIRKGKGPCRVRLRRI